MTPDRPSAPPADTATGGRPNPALVAGLRKIARTRGGPAAPPVQVAPGEESCEMCGQGIVPDHRHMLHLYERRILCVCESCLGLRSGDAEYRPTGTRFLWLEDFQLDDELWAEFGIPIGLAFFLNSGVSESILALYPSPAGATECELELAAWERLVAANPILAELEPDAEALIVNRMSSPAQHLIVPIDQCYALVGLIKSRWEGISGGAAIESSLPEFFGELRRRALVR